jgi:hypothetical protein
MPITAERQDRATGEDNREQKSADSRPQVIEAPRLRQHLDFSAIKRAWEEYKDK